jgi:mycofactocin system glycosyltransferase
VTSISKQAARFAAGFRVRLDPSAMTSADGKVLIGGSPREALRLDDRASELLEGLAHGEPLLVTESNRQVARALLEHGALQPVPAGKDDRANKVTVVIPVHDHAEHLARLLGNRDAFVGVAKIVVVDDGSTDPSSVPTQCARASHLPVQVIRNDDAQGPAAARNLGAAHVTTEFIVFVDADCQPEAGWLGPLLEQFDDDAVAAVAPRLRASRPARPEVASRRGALSTKLLDSLLAFELELGPLDRGPAPSIVGPGRPLSFVATAALAVRREVWDAVGRFDPTLRFGEDVDFTWRLAVSGWTVRYEPSSVVRHELRNGPREMIVQRYEYALPAASLAARHPGSFTPLRVEIPNAAAWTLAGVGYPWLAGAVAGTHLVASGQQMHSLGFTWPQVLRSRLRDQLYDGAHLARAMRRDLWPLSFVLCVAFRRFRLMAIVAAVVPPLLDWRRRKPSTSAPAWVALCLADGIVHGAGIWTSCLRARRLSALRPVWAAPPAAEAVQLDAR